MRNLKYLMSVAMIGGALAACDTDETSCTTDADCFGYMCVIADDGATEGVCESTCTNGCADGFVCGGETGTECVESTQTCADLDCGSYTCDETANACLTSCTAETGETDCVEGAQCDVVDDVGSCIELTADPYVYVAVVSRAQGEDALDNQNPGPDLDFISATSGGAASAASSVVASTQGIAGTEENTRPLSTHADAVLLQDATVTGDPDACNLDSQPGYVAIGGEGGFIAVQFANEFVTGDTITVVEIDSANCAPAVTERPDAYEVYVSNAAPAAGATAADIAGAWCLAGTQGGNGGTGTFTLDLSTCGM